MVVMVIAVPLRMFRAWSMRAYRTTARRFDQAAVDQAGAAATGEYRLDVYPLRVTLHIGFEHTRP
jgi:hypothetical protein